MAYPKNKQGAFLALALSGGLWAWQNRDKIGGWIDRQKGQLGSSSGTAARPGGESYTGATRRMNEADQPGPGVLPSPNEAPRSEI